MENKKELLKYMIFAGVMGIVVGGIDTVFGKGLILIGEIWNKYFWYLIPFLPIAGIVITWLYYHFNELSLKGMTLVFETGQQKRKGIPLALIPLVMIGPRCAAASSAACSCLPTSSSNQINVSRMMRSCASPIALNTAG